MIYNTMRFGTDIFQLEDDTVKLCIRINGAIVEIPLTATAASPAVALKTSNGIFYAQLVSPSDSAASPLRIRINGTIYALKG